MPARAKSAIPLHRIDANGRERPVFVNHYLPAHWAAMRPASTSSRGHAPWVTHDFATVAFHVGGVSRIEQGGRWSVGPGDAWLVPAGTPHRILDHHPSGDSSGDPSGDESEVWGLGLCASCLVAGDGAALLEPFDRVRRGASALVPIPPDRREFLIRLFRELRDLVSSAASEAVERSLLTLILHEISQAASWADRGPHTGGLVADSLRVIEHRCLGPLTLGDIAQAVDRSPAYVTTALRRATGRSAVEWIIAGRMAEARRRLARSDARVDAIAEHVGYADPTHFIRLFRREHGQTPAAWRASRRRSARGAPPRVPGVHQQALEDLHGGLEAAGRQHGGHGVGGS